MALLLPNYKIDFSNQSSGNWRSLSATLGPDANHPQPSQALTGNLSASVVAGSWHQDPQMYGVAEAMKDLGPGLATHSLRLNQGEMPDLRSLQVVTVQGAVDPHQTGSGAYSGGVRADGFADFGTSPVLQVLKAVAPTTNFPTWLPTHATASISSPAFAAQAQGQLTDDFLSGNFTGNVQIKDDANAWNEFKLSLFLKLTVAMVDTQMAFTRGEATASIDDIANDLRAVVSVDAPTERFEQTSSVQYYPVFNLTLRFLDIPTGNELGHLVYQYAPWKPLPNGLEIYPVLVLKNGDRLRMTPGVFTGQTTGGLNVLIQ
jgi:hypothetical protein